MPWIEPACGRPWPAIVETSIFAVRKLLSGENPSARSGSFKRAAAEVLGPYRQCYQPVNVPNVEADRPDVTFLHG